MLVADSFLDPFLFALALHLFVAVGGTLVGSFLIGGSETIFALFSKQAFAQTVVFLLAIVILRFRPAGVLRQR